MDSSVLLHVLSSILQQPKHQRRFKLRAFYVNHQISPNSEKWGEFCARQAKQFQVNFLSRKISIHKTARNSLEALARNSRYQLFADELESDEVLFTAHHARDQSETMLLQLLRGSGVAGLAAMPEYKVQNNYHHARPLLNVSFQKLYEYAQQHNLSWIEDESNQDIEIRRNFIRHRVLPLLEKHWPQYQTTLLRATKLQAESLGVLHEVAQADLDECQITQSCAYFNPYLLNYTKLTKLSEARLKNLVQYALKKWQFPELSSHLLSEFVHNIKQLYLSDEPKFVLKWQKDHRTFSFQRYRETLACFAELGVQVSHQWFFLQQPSYLIENLDLLVRYFPNSLSEPTKTHLGDSVIIRFYNGEHELRQAGIELPFSLKKWFQKQAIPPWVRGRIPIICTKNQVIQLGSEWINPLFSEHGDDLFKIELYP